MPFTGLTAVEHKGNWSFVPPSEWMTFYDDLYAMGDALDWEAPTQLQLRQHRKLLDSVVMLFPDWVQAYSLRSEVNFRLGKFLSAIADAQAGIDICLNCFPNREIPKGAKICYYDVDNRPFFRVFYKRARYYLDAAVESERRTQLENAFRLSSLLLDLHPNDNVGARAIAIPCALELGSYQRVLKLTSDWKKTTCPETLYGRTLAAFALEKTDLANQVVEQAIHCNPLIAVR
jgi:tetratricopeptide (TPR) repeat protein